MRIALPVIPRGLWFTACVATLGATGAAACSPAGEEAGQPQAEASRTAISAVSLDLSKLAAKGAGEIEKAVGAGNVAGPGAIYFRDGAASIDLEPVFDQAAFFYWVEVKPGLLPVDDMRLGYRLGLNGNQDLVLVEIKGEDGQLQISAPGEGLVTLKPETAEAEVRALIARMKEAAPGGEFDFLSAVGILTYKAPVLEAVRVLRELKRSPIVTGVEPNGEVYRVAFSFDPVVKVEAEGKIDADQYRGLTRRLREDGAQFTTETTIPEDLQ